MANPSGEVSTANRGTVAGHPGLHYLMIPPVTLEPVLISLPKESDTGAQRPEMTYTKLFSSWEAKLGHPSLLWLPA